MSKMDLLNIKTGVSFKLQTLFQIGEKIRRFTNIYF